MTTSPDIHSLAGAFALDAFAGCFTVRLEVAA
jgi:hypothetical protein